GVAAIGTALQNGGPSVNFSILIERAAHVHNAGVVGVYADDVIVVTLRHQPTAAAVFARPLQPLPGVAAVGAAQHPRGYAILVVCVHKVDAAASQQGVGVGWRHSDGEAGQLGILLGVIRI